MEVQRCTLVRVWSDGASSSFNPKQWIQIPTYPRSWVLPIEWLFNLVVRFAIASVIIGTTDLDNIQSQSWKMSKTYPKCIQNVFKKQMGIKMGSCSILFGFATFLALGVSLVSERCMSLSMSLMWMVRSWLQLGSIQLNVSLLPGIDRSSFRVGSLASCHCATGSRNKILV